MVEAQLSSETWRATLDRETPWWSKMAVAALNRLNAAVPEHHFKKELTESRLSWFSGDPIASALGLLDDVLAVEPAPPFDALQNRLVQTVAAKWRGWPPFTKALTLSSLRGLFWHGFPALRSLLAETIQSEPNPVVVRYAVDRLVQLVFVEPAPELSEFMKRAAAGGHGDSLRQVAKVLGVATVAATLPSAKSRLGELDDLFRQTLGMNWPDPQAFLELLEGALIGATDWAQGEWTPAVEQAWLRTITSLVSHWPFDKSGSDDRERFPLHALWSVIVTQATPDARARLFVELSRTLETILRKADLGAYCSLHFELIGLIAGRHQRISGKPKREWQAGIPASESVEDALLVLIRASVDRVVAWKREGKRTDDLGWRSSLDGRDAADLVKACMDWSRDREQMRRELVPLGDMLADAGLSNVAADLLVHLRRA